MAKRQTPYETADGQSYLTKRILIAKAKAAGKKAVENAMEVMGYVVIAEDNEVVRKHADGRREVIAAIEQAN
ncbi:MAG: hypothetical protein ABIN67_15200 [Ferruginibacter sp.]